MADESHLDILGQGVRYWNERRAPYNRLVDNPLVEPNLSGADLSEAHLSGADLTGTDLTGANLSKAILRGADLLGANLKGAILHGANLKGAILKLANLEGADLEGAHLFGADFFGANLKGAILHGANLEGAHLVGTNLRMADLSMATLIEADFSRADPTKAEGMRFLDFIDDVRERLYRKADDPEYWEIISNATPSDRSLYELRLGIEAYESWLTREAANLSGVKLDGAWLLRANLSGANLKGASLEGASLDGADLSKADLSSANLSSANLSEANLSMVNLSKANLSEANLTGSTLVKTNLIGATLTGCRIYGISAWSLNLKGAKQWNLNVSDVNEPAVMVDNLEVAQFIYLLLNHKKLRDVLNAITERGVLILGRFGGGGLEVLEAIAAKLRESKYQPFIFDFDRPADRNYTETVKTLVGLSRFVIVDLSGPSVPQELYATVPHFKIPFVPIIEEGRRQYSMLIDILEYPWVLDPPVLFVDVEHLIKAMPTQIIAPAEEWVKDRQDRLADLFEA
jgi:uncharacterized protein YjbI with pentapeptide repeats